MQDPRDLDRMSRSADAFTRWEVATHPNTGAATLAAMREASIERTGESMLITVARAYDGHPTAQAEHDDLVQEEAELRAAIGEHPNCSPELLALLAEDRQTVVRGAVARNPNTPVPVLQKLVTAQQSLAPRGTRYNYYRSAEEIQAERVNDAMQAKVFKEAQSNLVARS